MTLRKGFLFCFLSLCQWIFAQQDSIHLAQVIVSDSRLKNFSNTQSVEKLNDSVLRKNPSSLTDLLRYNSVIYFKENGPGMVSSPAFRGTTAQQTAVIWNGININSQFNGQTDFNTIAAKDFDNISVRSGGGSVLYGSSAIGGSVHLNSALSFGKHFENMFSSEYGSFNTIGIDYKTAFGTEKFVFDASVSHNSSDNDFDYPHGKNSNGQFYNTGFNTAAGYKLNEKNWIKYYGYAFDGTRHFSLINPSDTKTKYRDFNTRNLVEWDGFYGRYTAKTSIALITEEYNYYETLETTSPDYGKATSAIAKYDASFALMPKMILDAVADFTRTQGNGSDVGDHIRQTGTLSVLLKQEILDRFNYEIGVRKEVSDVTKSPLLFSAGMSCNFGAYTLKWNGSRNFRIPTFNDLYWFDGGNRNLKPESSFQTEIGNELQFKSLKFTVTGYLINIDDMIQWLPGTTQTWHPVNINKVRTYGIEATANWEKNFGKHKLAFSGTYAYTVSKNLLTGYQLIYVPYHKATAAIAWSWKRFSADYQVLGNGEVFTRSDNNPRYNIDAYSVSDVSAGYRFGRFRQMQAGAKIRNLFNTQYQVVEGRHFPGRNYNVYLTLNF